jgi:hypothetical protein
MLQALAFSLSAPDKQMPLAEATTGGVESFRGIMSAAVDTMRALLIFVGI